MVSTLGQAAPPASAAPSVNRPSPSDIGPAVVVLLVAVPLCLGIAMASGAPLVAGVVSGIIGGVVVGLLSPSAVQVSGPAAGLTAVMLTAVADLGSFSRVLPAVAVAGALQLALGGLRLGGLVRFVPSSVIKGMLASIGIILVLKQLPHIVGWDADAMGDESFLQPDHENTFSELLVAAQHISPGPALVGLSALALLLAAGRWGQKWARVAPPALVVVLGAIALAAALPGVAPGLAVTADHRVALPAGGFSSFLAALPRPDWSVLLTVDGWRVGITLGLVASLETLLSLDAAVRLDPLRRPACPNRELLAQGVGNLLCGALGGLPVTGVIVRTSANIDAGGRTRWSAVLHGALLAAAALAFPLLLNAIPLSALAAILLLTGYRLARPSLLREVRATGRTPTAVFAVTVAAILFTDLLTGIGVGLAVGGCAILWQHTRIPGWRDTSPPGAVLARLALVEQVTFLHRAALAERLAAVPDGGRIEIDGRACKRMDPDVIALLHEFAHEAPLRGVDVRLVGIPSGVRTTNAH